jgi:adenylosuccinate lyase
MSALSNISQSAHKIATDIRLLQGLQELEEPFGEKQVGSSAMPYKRNPMRSERVCSLARFVMQNAELGGWNHAVQWLERSLDDSANRRFAIPECFLATDAILLIMINIFKGLQVYPKLIENRIQANLPFLTAEYVIMESVKKGQDRQDVHEVFREKAMEAVRKMKEEGIEVDLIKNLGESPEIVLEEKDLRNVLDPANMVGRASRQVDEFMECVIQPILKENEDKIEENEVELKV